MHPVENKILNYLLDKYENSKLSRGENQRAIHIAFPFNKKTMPKYFDESSLEIETIHAAAEQMEREGLVAIAWKNQKPGYIIEKLVLCEDHVEEAYERLGRKPKREAEARTKQILEQFYQKTQGEITRSFLSHMIMRLEREQSVKEYLDIMDHRKTEQLIDTLDKDAFSSNADEPTLAKLFGKVTSSRFVPLNAIVPIFFKPSGRTTLVKFVHW